MRSLSGDFTLVLPVVCFYPSCILMKECNNSSHVGVIHVRWSGRLAPTLFVQASLPFHSGDVLFRVGLGQPALAHGSGLNSGFDCSRHLVGRPRRGCWEGRSFERRKDVPRNVHPCLLLLYQIPNPYRIPCDQVLDVHLVILHPPIHPAHPPKSAHPPKRNSAWHTSRGRGTHLIPRKRDGKGQGSALCE